MRSPIARLTPDAPTSPEQIAEWRKRAWREQGVAIFDVQAIPSWDIRQLIIQYAEALYGKR